MKHEKTLDNTNARGTPLFKKVISLLLCLVLMMSLLPTTAWGDDRNPINKLGWNYAVISQNISGGYTVQKAGDRTGPDYSSHVTVKVGETTLTKGQANFAVTDNNLDTTVTITADSGYYVAYVVLCCNDAKGYSCKTSRSENALGTRGSMNGAAVTTTLRALRNNTPHKTGNAYGPGNPYWLMVMVAPIPNPVYVGYDAGTAGGTTINADPVVKDSVSDGGTWETNYFVKKYPTANSAPNHSVLSVSNDAIAEAATIVTKDAPYGYEFAGWQLTYYVSYNAGEFSGETDAGQGGKKNPTDTISLFTHAKLVAQWVAKEAPATGSLTITKTNTGATPKSVTFAVTGTDYSNTVTLNSANNWTTTISDLPVGTYTVTESGADVDGYTLNTTGTGNVTVTAGGTATVTVTNTYSKEKTSVEVEKKWVDSDNAYSTRPASVTVKLLANGEDTGKTLTLTAANNWKGTFDNLDKYTYNDDGSKKAEISYTVQELDVNGKYTASVDGYTVTNTLKTGSVTIKKAFKGLTSDEYKDLNIQFTVTYSGSVSAYSKTVTLNEANNWTATLTGLPLGESYTLTENKDSAQVDHYTLNSIEYNRDNTIVGRHNCITFSLDAHIAGNDNKTYTVTNSYQPVKTSVSVTKVWDNKWGDFTAPTSDVTVTLYANGTATSTTATLNAANNWTHTFTNLREYDASGSEIDYTVEEAAFPGYQAGVVTGTATNGYTIKNTPNWSDSETKATLTVVKVDSADTTKKLAGATFTLYNADKTNVVGAAKATGDDGTITFDGLTEGTYTLEETKAPAGYIAAADTTITIGAGNKSIEPIKDSDGNVIGYEKHITYANQTVTVNNTMNVETTNRVKPATLTIKKVDSEDNTKTLTGAAFTLTKGTTTLNSKDNGDGTYTISGIKEAGEWTLTEVTAPAGYDKDENKTWTISVEKTTSEPELDAEKNTYYRTDTYSIKDDVTFGVKDGKIDIKNIKKTIEIAPTKVWKNADGITLPVSIQVELYKNGVATGEYVVLTPPSEGDKWTSEAKFTNLPTHEDGVAITYTVKEVGYVAKGTTVMTGGVPAGFTSVEGNEANGYTITNTANWADTDVVNPASLTIKKVDKEGNALSGAKFTLYEKENACDAAETGADGIATFTGLGVGVYELYESAAPAGYKTISGAWTVKVEKNTELTEVKLVDGVYYKVYDCTVTVEEKDGSSFASDDQGNYVLTIENEAIPENFTYKLPIEKIVEKSGGNTNPGNETFLFAAYYLDDDGNKVNIGSASIETTGVGTYNGDTLEVTVPSKLVELDKNGAGAFTLYVAEVAGSTSGWTYDTTVYTVTVEVTGYEAGNYTAVVVGEELEEGAELVPVETLSFTNTYKRSYTPNKPNKPSKPVPSVKTGDAGVAMYAVSGLLSLGGAALFLKKRKEDEE